jgi:probable HAF family extracellular repeat protein
LADGLQDIGVPNHNSDADAISADGSAIVGEFEFQVRPFHLYHAFRWTAEPGMLDLGTLGDAQSRALATNSDGSVVGLTSNHAFRWTPQTGIQDLNQLVGAGNCGGHPWPPDCFVLKSAMGVSADGTVITGTTLAPSPDSTWPVEVPFRAIVPVP